MPVRPRSSRLVWLEFPENVKSAVASNAAAAAVPGANKGSCSGGDFDAK